MVLKNGLACTGVLLLGILTASAIQAAPISQAFSGTLSSTSQVLQEDFTINAMSAVTIFTNSYGGGTNLDGTTTSAGGFQPNIWTFGPVLAKLVMVIHFPNMCGVSLGNKVHTAFSFYFFFTRLYL